jgi:hypothetical protein
MLRRPAAAHKVIDGGLGDLEGTRHRVDRCARRARGGNQDGGDRLFSFVVSGKSRPARSNGSEDEEIMLRSVRSLAGGRL